MKVFADQHHSSLTRSLVMLFENRLGAELYRPVGMEWFGAGFWAINDQLDTARQYLDFASQRLADGTPLLNSIADNMGDGIYNIHDPGEASTHRAIRLDTFKSMRFDYLIASIPAHIPIFERLIREFQPQAKLIVQVGNNWSPDIVRGYNVMASVKRGMYPDSNTVYYRQEFDTNIFCPSDTPPLLRISSYANCLSELPVGWFDFRRLEDSLGVPMFSYGGQCRDGNMAGPHALAESMQQDSMVFHVKDGGDGYGHIAHNALACGKPLIHRGQFTKGTLIGDLLNEHNSMDLDEYGEREADEHILSVIHDELELGRMSRAAGRAFNGHVCFDCDAERVRLWLETL